MTIPGPNDNRDQDPAPLPDETSPCTTPDSPQASGPPLTAVPIRQNLLGLRVAAALVDVALCCGLFIIVGLTTGGTPAPLPPGHSSMIIGGVAAGTWWIRFGEVTVAGRWLALYLAVLLACYFTVEAATGQTPGKRLLGLRIADAHGNRPPARAIAARTLLRLVDWLPVLYLAGFISMLATGKRRQRLGDLAAGTQTGFAPGPFQRRRRPVLAGILAGLAIVGLSTRVASGGPLRLTSAGSSQACHGVSFRYPAGWRQEHVANRVTGSHQLCQTGLFIGPSDGIVISAFSLPVRVTATNLAALTPSFTREVRQAARQDDGALQAGPQPIRAGGLPALEFRVSGRSYDGARTVSTVVLAFNGITQYEVLCQYTQQHAMQVRQACDQILRTFTVSAPASL